MSNNGSRSGVTPAIDTTAQAPQPAPAPAAQAASRLVSDTGVQDMDDATMTALIRRAISAPTAADGRDDTMAQRIADALGISQNRPEMVDDDDLAQYRSGTYDAGTLYRTVNNVPGKTAQQMVQEMTTGSGSYGYNYGGGRAYGVGVYFAGKGSRDRDSGAEHSASNYGYPGRSPYTVEAVVKQGAKIATNADLQGAKAKAWSLAHRGALAKAGLRVDASGNTHPTGSMRQEDGYSIKAMLMGYDGYHEPASSIPYYTVFNLGALRMARGNKYRAAVSGQLR